jgi:Family of unknown function (DUF5641)
MRIKGIITSGLLYWNDISKAKAISPINLVTGQKKRFITTQEYLKTLNKRNKWVKEIDSKKHMNWLVHFITDMQHRKKWTIAQVVKLKVSCDEKIREVIVPVPKKKKTTRAINRIILLPNNS